MKKIIRIVGARPQFMQIPIVSKQLKKFNIEEILIHTGQHYDNNLSKIFFDELGIKQPDYNLSIGSGSNCSQTANIIKTLEDKLTDIKPDLVLVDGDTNSTLAAALTAAKLNIKVAHIEAGIRIIGESNPEELNRHLTDHLATINFAPTKDAYNNLVKEDLGNISHFVGDVLLDCYIDNENKADEKIIQEHNLQADQYYLCTLHRPENTDLKNYQRFKNIFLALEELDRQVILPLHPRSKTVFNEYEKNHKVKNIKIIDPVSYFQIIALTKNSKAVITDSGGLQREANWSGKPCVVAYDRVIWKEQTDKGWTVVSGVEKQKVLDAFDELKTPSPNDARGLYGNGLASKKVAEKLNNLLG